MDLIKKLEPRKQAVVTDFFDHKFFNEVKATNKDLLQWCSKGLDIYPYFRELQQDIFNVLFKYNPILTPNDALKYEYMINRMVIEELIKLPKYAELRNYTRLDVMNAGSGTVFLSEVAIEIIEKLMEESEQMKQIIEAMKQAAQDAQQQDGEESEDEENSGKAGHQRSDKEITLDEAKELLKKEKDKIRKQVKSNLKRLGRIAIDKAITKAVKTSDMISNWGLETSDSFSLGGYQEKLDALEKINKSRKLRDIATKLGKFQGIAKRTQMRKSKYGTESIRGNTVGDDVCRLVPQEYMQLTRPGLKLLLRKKLTEKEALQYKFDGVTEYAKGPIVGCIDSSGSMEGENEVWAKAVMLGILNIAQKQCRSVYVIHFSSQQYTKENPLHSNMFMKNKPLDMSEVINMCEYFYNGGTSFEPPLRQAMDIIDEHKAFKKADIVFITDGESAVDNTWLKKFNEWKRRKKVSVSSVLVDAHHNSDATLKEFSDSITKVSEFGSADEEVVVSLYDSL